VQRLPPDLLDFDFGVLVVGERHGVELRDLGSQHRFDLGALQLFVGQQHRVQRGSPGLDEFQHHPRRLVEHELVQWDPGDVERVERGRVHLDLDLDLDLDRSDALQFRFVELLEFVEHAERQFQLQQLVVGLFEQR
jgi:hypothetical protein